MSVYTVSYQVMMTINGPQVVALGGFTQVQTVGRLNPNYAADDVRQAFRDIGRGFTF